MKFQEQSKYDVVSLSDSYIDLRNIADDRTVLKNPHKGWYFHYISNGYGRPKYRDTIHEGDHLEWLEGLNMLYLRFNWADIEKEEGVLDWSYIDSIMEEWSKFGYTFALRVVTCEGVGLKTGVPEWLIDMGINGSYPDEKVYKELLGEDFSFSKNAILGFEPDYKDPIYLEKLENFMKKMGEKFNNHPLIENIDVGTYGTWGEGHTWMGSMKHWDLETLIKHVNLHLKYFPDKHILVNDDMIAHIKGVSAEDGSKFVQYCTARGIGLRDDSLLVESCIALEGYSSLRSAFYHQYFNENAPSDLECENWGSDRQGCFPYLEAIRQTKTTYSGFQADPYLWYENYKHFSEYAANRLGYWYFIDGIDLPQSYSGAYTMMKLYLRNEGVSKAYHKYDLKIIAENESGTYILNEESPDNRRWDGESSYTETLKLNFRKVPAGKYAFKIGLFEKDVPIQLAFKKDILDGAGYYKLCEIEVLELL